MLRPEEKVFADRLQSLLVRQGRNVEYTEGDNPPDCDFGVDGRRWGLEITGLVPQLLFKGKTQPRLAIDNQMMTIERDIAARAKSLGGPNLKGAYLLSLLGPFTKTERMGIIRQAVEHILSGVGNPLDLLGDGHALIKRTRKTGKLQVGSVTSVRPFQKLADGVGSDSYDLNAVLSHCVEGALARKLSRLGSLTGYDEIVLGLWHEIDWYDGEQLAGKLVQLLPKGHNISRCYYLDPVKILQVYPNVATPVHINPKRQRR